MKSMKLFYFLLFPLYLKYTEQKMAVGFEGDCTMDLQNMCN